MSIGPVNLNEHGSQFQQIDSLWLTYSEYLTGSEFSNKNMYVKRPKDELSVVVDLGFLLGARKLDYKNADCFIGDISYHLGESSSSLIIIKKKLLDKVEEHGPHHKWLNLAYLEV